MVSTKKLCFSQSMSTDLLQLQYPNKAPRDLVKNADSDSAGLGWFNKFPGDATDTGPQTMP